jgi:Ca2+/H+ antiporter, TMEM165/GDT1 family
VEAFLVSLSAVAFAEIGDRTQLLALVLAARYRKPWPIIAGIVLATLTNHLAAGAIGIWLGHYLTRAVLDCVVGVCLLAMAAWTLKPDNAGSEPDMSARGAFLATLVLFFLAEIGDKTQIATVALAAGYSNLIAVVAGSTLGLLLANIPVVFLGHAFAARLPMKAIRYSAAALFAVLGIVFLVKAVAG